MRRGERLTCCGLNGALRERPLQDCFQKYFWSNIPIFVPLILDPGLAIHSLNALRSLVFMLQVMEAGLCPCGQWWLFIIVGESTHGRGGSCVPVLLVCCSTSTWATSHPKSLFHPTLAWDNELIWHLAEMSVCATMMISVPAAWHTMQELCLSWDFVVEVCL